MKMKGVDELVLKLFWGQLQQMGLFKEKKFSKENLIAKIMVTNLYTRWLEYSITIFEKNNYLELNGNVYTVVDSNLTDIDSLWKEWNTKRANWIKDLNKKARVEFVENTLLALPEILTGKRLATDVIFNNSSIKLVEGVYKNSIVADYFNDVLCDTLEAFVNAEIKKNPSGSIRIIEIGAGTGGTSIKVFERLKKYGNYIKEYCYTDISKAFIMHAEKEFLSENPYLTFKIFNVENTPASQDVELAQYDLVIAANVLHATKNIKQTVRNAKVLIKKNGLILLSEMIGSSLFTHLTFGLLEGWWVYEDTGLRIEGCPGLYPETWEMILEDEGFNSVFFPAKKAHDLNQQVIVAQSDGVIRQGKSNNKDGIKEIKQDKYNQNNEEFRNLKQQLKEEKTNVIIMDEVTSYSIDEYIKNIIVEKITKELKVDASNIDFDESFADYGLDSIIGVNLVQVINDALNIDLETTSLFDYSSVNQLSSYILSKYEGFIGELLKKNRIEKEVKPLEIKADIILSNYTELSNRTVESYVKDLVKRNISKELKVDESDIEDDESFADYGLDSIMGVSLVQIINRALNIDLETTSLFDYSSVNQLTSYILSEYKDNISKDIFEKIEIEKINSERVTVQFPINRLLAEKDLKEVAEDNKESDNEKILEQQPIAIIGVSGRYAKSSNIGELWDNLCNGIESIEEVSRWDLSEYYPKDKNYCNNGGFISEIDKFDPSFFNISGLEATYMDPQQRIFLEESWKAIEDAGYAGSGIQSKLCGVYVGCGGGDYSQLFKDDVPPQAFWGAAGSIVPSRISYYLDLQGPAISVDTACSSSLVAMHIACQALWTKEIDMALAGGIFLQSSLCFYLNSIRAGMLSPSGHSYTFDTRADGFVPGEGVGVVVLKRLEDAIKDGDNIYGVIKGIGINQDGTTNGITAPSSKSQQRLESYIYDNFNINPERISMVEAHGTGTKLGDPIEFNALTRAFRKFTEKREYCAIGSIKTNIGHTAHAAGIAGVIKVLMALKNKKIPPSLNFESGNLNIDFSNSPFYVNTTISDWDTDSNTKRLAAVSSFGFSGTNAHMVIEEAPNMNCRKKENPSYLIVLSARNSEQLQNQVEQLLSYCKKELNIDCGNISYTLLLGRKHFKHRFACIITSQEELCKSLEEWLNYGKSSHVYYSQSEENEQSQQMSLKAYGNLCISNCEKTEKANEYLQLLSAIAELFVQGYDFNFQSLFSNEKYYKISLPTYPFARERYWVDTKETKFERLKIRKKEAIETKPSAHIKSNNMVKADSEIMIFEEVWQENKLKYTSLCGIKTLVCFISNLKNQQLFINQIKNIYPDIKVIFISQGMRYQKKEQGSYEICLTQPDSFNIAFQDIIKDYRDVEAILYLWALEDTNIIEDCSPIVHILKEIKKTNLKPKRVILSGKYTNELQHCYIDSWIGIERSLKLVLLNTEVAVVSQQALGDGSHKEMEELIGNVLSELQAKNLESILYKEGKRQICKIKQKVISEAKSILRPRGTYLITGGCGGLGLIFAEYLIKKYQVNLVLTGRRLLDTEKKLKIQDLEKMGGRVLYMQADICDYTSMREVINSAKRYFGEINGVIQAAGIEIPKSIFEKEMKIFQEVIDTKVKGALILDEVIGNEEIDFICYFSSSASILGDLGSCDYSMANRFQISYGHYRDKQHLQGKSIVINWPLWRNGGMTVGEEDSTNMYLKTSGQSFLESNDGIKLFELLLSSNSSHHLILKGQPEKVKRFLGVTNSTKSGLNSNKKPNKERKIKMKGFSIEQCIEWDCKDIISNLLKTSRNKLNSNENLSDFGFDSITLAEFATLLTKHYEIEIIPAIFYSYTTLEKLVGYFMETHENAIKEFYNNETLNEDTLSEDFYEANYRVETNLNDQVEVQKEKSDKEDIPEPIAIIGISGRFPGSRNIDEMWDILEREENVVKEIPKDRFDWKLYYGNSTIDVSKTNCKWCGCIPGVKEFDPLFFEISPKEAETMDPRQRILMQEAWKALEDAGYGTNSIKQNKIGMFVGIEHSDYYNLVRGKGGLTSNNNSVLASRLAYFLDFNGPVMAIDTACSSGLVAIHQACLSLRNKECTTAIAAAANLLLTPEMFVGISQAGMFSNDGKCFAFDKRANGMVPGEAVAAVVLKPLSKAKIDGDPIYAVIKGSEINYDGKTNGITAPSGISQTALLKSVYDKYKINPRDIEYIITHGTGTKLGDPVEVNAMYDAFKKYTNKQGFCAITSNKTNFGHTFAASGLVSLTNLVQAFRHGVIPASLNYEQENEYINWNNSPFYVNKTKKSWEINNGKSHLGALSAFGMSGTNVHMVLESYQEHQGDNLKYQSPYYIITLSAKTQEALQEKINDMICLFEKGKLKNEDLPQISYTLLEGRFHFNYRLVIVIQDIEDALYSLRQVLIAEKSPNVFKGKVTREFTAQKAIQGYIRELLMGSLTMKKDKDKYLETFYALSEFYCQGYNIEWVKLFGDSKPKRINLPTYPFEKRNYWISSDMVIDSKVPVNNNEQRKNYYLSKQWKSVTDISVREVKGIVAILVDEDTKDIALQITKSFENSRIIDISQVKTYVENQCNNWHVYDGIIDLIGCGDGKNKDLEWITLLQKLIEKRSKKGLMLLCVTKGLELYKNSLVNLSGASRVGLYRMLQSEYNNLISRHLDVESAIKNDELIKQILDEYLNNNNVSEVCYRNKKRYESFLNEVKQGDFQRRTLEFSKDEVLFITGGTRGLGFMCARHFVKHYGVKKIVLTGQEVFPPREEWDIFKDQNNSIGEKIRNIKALENYGVEIQVLTIQLSNFNVLMEHLQEINDTMGTIGGIIHCAGIGDTENPAFIKKQLSGIKKVLEPKVTAVSEVFEVFKNEPLKFFVLFSSVSSIIPALAAGQSDYAMANAFMDYFAEAKYGKCSIVSIQWPSWKETGMGEMKSRTYKETGLLSMRDEEGLKLLDDIISRKMGPVILPAVVNPTQWNPSTLLKHASKNIISYPRESSVKREVKLTNTKEQVILYIEKWLINLFSKELKFDYTKIEIDVPFQDYGVDSILLTQLLRTINQSFEIEIDPSSIYEFTTMKSFAIWLVSNYFSACENSLANNCDKEVCNEEMESLSEDTIVSSDKASTKENEAVSIKPKSNDIAVVGISCRFPGANTIEEYWELLSQGKSAIGPISPDRWGYDSKLFAGLLDNITDFDPKFFLISKEDAKVMDPQALILLEESLKLIHNAGYSIEEIKGKQVGVYIGGRSQHRPSENILNNAKNVILGVGQNYLATNISQFLDLKGASVVIDTACSSALVGMNMAVQELQNGEMDSAIVGGISLLNTDEVLRMFKQRGILSEKPAFHVFDDRSGGIILGEGVGMVLLKTVSKAIEDGDNIYATIKSIAVNNDGRTAGPATPNIQSQKEVMKAALVKSDKSPEEITYIEANGSGSEVTDLLELKAIQSIYRGDYTKPCAIGSIKPNIGHPLCAEGIASFIKVTLMLYNKKIVPFLSGNKPMKHFDVEASPFYFSRELTEWTSDKSTAAINCFADGGTNVHVILEACDNETVLGAKRCSLGVPSLSKYNVYGGAKVEEKKLNVFWKQ
ncbi:SDR family NAD(P)-dependent oxidoreductase [Clostridium estertheticum]|uniref:SDR family NAD(P)-dependent oxidoreductase n=1 Tax=Clostridium estertheticum TaxID=238834 RepID=UPI001CF1B26D|nr:SDR family NAD(P)-dependent oxidoreductase [Clostridium estertheticum]MCB2360149.1 SDR family NAD(P)-dependent oxidoreductase [Clostridium estertheticum]